MWWFPTMITSTALLFSHYLLYYRHYILSHYTFSLRLQSCCQRSSHIFVHLSLKYDSSYSRHVLPYTERWWLISYPPSSVAMSSPPTIYLWWMASRWNRGSSEGITNVTRFSHMTNGVHFNTLGFNTFKPYKHNIPLVEIHSCVKGSIFLI